MDVSPDFLKTKALTQPCFIAHNLLLASAPVPRAVLICSHGDTVLCAPVTHTCLLLSWAQWADKCPISGDRV